MSKAVFRNKRRDNFTIIANAALRNPNLSLKAKGLLALMLSFPDDWQYHMSHIEQQSTDGRDSLRSGLRELLNAGYLERTRVRDGDGKLGGYEYCVGDEIPSTDGFSGAGFPGAGQPAATKTDSTKTEDQEQTLSSKASPKAEAMFNGERSLSTAEADAITGEFARVWNEHCGPLPSVKRSTGARRKAVMKLVREHGFDEALDMFAKAVRVVAADEFWVKKKYGLENLLRDGRVVEKAEQAEADEKPMAALLKGDKVQFVDMSQPRQPTVQGVVMQVDDDRVHVRVGDRARVVMAQHVRHV